MAEETAAAVSVDLDQIDSSLIAENITLNPDVNPMEAPPPVDDGTHRVKLVGATDWVNKDTKPNKQGNSTSYLSTKFSAIVIAEGTKNNNKRVFKNWVSTLVFDGKNEMGYILLQIFGGKNNPEARQKVAALTNYVDLAKAFRTALAAEPIIRVSTKWVASYNAGTKEEPDYKTAKTGQKTFPSNGAGGHIPVVEVKGVGEVRAVAEIQDYFPE